MHARLDDLISEVVVNAIESGARHIYVAQSTGPERCSIVVTDDGEGMNPGQLRQCWDPRPERRAKHAARRMGLGLPFLRQTVEAAGGQATIRSAPGQGTRVAFEYDPAHVDAPPVQDLPATIMSLLAYPGPHDLQWSRHRDRAPVWTLSRTELLEAWGDLEHTTNLATLRKLLETLETKWTETATT